MKPVVDFQSAIDALVDRLALLYAHIGEHQMHECWERDLDEIALFIEKISLATDINLSFEENDLYWDEAWEYLKNNMNKWWC